MSPSCQMPFQGVQVQWHPRMGCVSRCGSVNTEPWQCEPCLMLTISWHAVVIMPTYK